MATIRLGIRPSLLARKQAEEIARFFTGVTLVPVLFQTPGDRDKRTPLSSVEGSDFFTRDIDEALLAGTIDAAVHSSKDLPERLPSGLVVALETDPISRNDAFVSRGGLMLRELAAGSRIGTSSLRRKEQVVALRPDLAVVDVRGTIEERLSLISQRIIDGLIVAEAALIRLGLRHKAAEVFPVSIFETHPKQGSLSLVVRKDTWQRAKYTLSELGRAIGS